MMMMSLMIVLNGLSSAVTDDSEDELDENSASGIELNNKDRLAQWAVNFSISQTALTALLTILPTCDGVLINNLPKYARTLLSAERHIDIGLKAGGDYYYIGI